MLFVESNYNDNGRTEINTCYLLLGETVSCNFESGDACGWKNENFTVSEFKSNLEQSGPEKAFEGGLYDNSLICHWFCSLFFESQLDTCMSLY